MAVKEVRTARLIFNDANKKKTNVTIKTGMDDDKVGAISDAIKTLLTDTQSVQKYEAVATTTDIE